MKTINRPWRLAASVAFAFLLVNCGGGGSAAQPDAREHRLQIDIAGSGTVTSSPPGLSCASPCGKAFEAGTRLLLNAVAGVGYAFDGWSGACRGTAPCPVAIDQATSVVANFSPVTPVAGAPHALISPSGNGH